MSELGFFGESEGEDEFRDANPERVRKDGGNLRDEQPKLTPAPENKGSPPAAGGLEHAKATSTGDEACEEPGEEASREVGKGAGQGPEIQPPLFDNKADDSDVKKGKPQGALSPASYSDAIEVAPSADPPAQAAGLTYDPTDPEMLPSREGTDIPVRSPFGYVSGTRHPQLQDLAKYLQPQEPGSIWLPAAIPLVHTPGQSPLDRVPIYGKTIVWQSPERCTHLLVLGKTGGGKNTRLLDLLRYSALLDPAQSVVSVSLKSSDYGPIKAACDRAGKECIVVNFDDDRRSFGFNPLQRATKNEAPDIIRRLADSGRNPRSHDSEFWTQMLRTGMQALYEGGYRSFPEMFRFFTGSRKKMVEGFERLNNVNAEKMRDFLSGGSWNADTTEATIVGSFVAFQQESVQRVMSRDELRLDTLFERPVCLHIEVDEASLETVLPLVQMLLRTVVDRLIKTAQRRGDTAVPTTLFVDDLPSLGPVFSVERLLTLRSRKVGVVAGTQSIAALNHAYIHSGPAILEAFANQVALPGCSPEDADYFARASGLQLVSLPGVPGQTPQYMGQSLLSAADVRSASYEHFLLGRPLTFMLGDLAFQAYVQYSFEVPAWREILRAAKGVTGTERLRARRLPNLFRQESWQAARRKLRKLKPEATRFPIKFRPADVTHWSDRDFRTAIKIGLKQLAFDSTAVDVRIWWDDFQIRNRSNLWTVLRIVSELVELDSSMTEFKDMARECDSRSADVAIAYLVFRRKRAEANKADGGDKDAGGQAKGEPKDDSGISNRKPSFSERKRRLFEAGPEPDEEDEDSDDIEESDEDLGNDWLDEEGLSEPF